MRFDIEKLKLRKYRKKVNIINSFHSKYMSLSEEDIIKEYELILKINCRKTTILMLLALAKKVMSLVYKIELFDVQMIGALALIENNIVEMKTGEGKTYVAICAAFVSFSVERKKIYIFTANDYLSNRDSNIAFEFYNKFNIKVDNVSPVTDSSRKKEIYSSDIIYTTAKELVFDYLRDNLVYDKRDVLVNDLEYAIIDEADFVLLDDARTPFVLTGNNVNQDKDYYLFNVMSKSFEIDVDFELFSKTNSIKINEVGFTKLEDSLLKRNLLNKSSDLYLPKNSRFIELMLNALSANHLLKENVDYVIQQSKVTIVDQKTGRLSEGSQFKNGLHQAVEAKEKVEIKKEQKIRSSISLQNFLKKFNSLSGMTGTARTEKKELKSMYGLSVVGIPTNKDILREDLEDYIFYTKEQKNKAILEKTEEISRTKQPLLVGTTTIEYSEELSALFTERGIVHTVLNAKNHERESEIIASSGRLGAVTIVTNMAGRGTDIILGGDRDIHIKEHGSSGHTENFSNDSYIESVKKVKLLGGLYILGAERNDSRRLDNQLIGRSGRQGDCGTTQFYVSLDDRILADFSDNASLKKMWKRLGLHNEAANNSFLSNSVLKVQKIIDGLNHDSRKNMLMFDQINEDQRNIYFEFRKKILNINDIKSFSLQFSKKFLKRFVYEYANNIIPFERWDLKALQLKLKKAYSIEIDIIDGVKSGALKTEVDILNAITASLDSVLSEQLNRIDNDGLFREIILKSIDDKWSLQLSSINNLKQNVQFRGYAQEKPLDEYKKEMLREFTLYLMEMEKAVFINCVKLRDFNPNDIANMSYEEFYAYVLDKTNSSFGFGQVFYGGV
jgi:preprotein translocase subunit SecA